jgi:predicted phage terminase large subunit-like protein
MGTMINLKQAQTWLMKKDLHEFVKEMWDSYDPSPFSDTWLVEYLCECYMYSVRHFLPRYCWGYWITDEEYEAIKKKTGGHCEIRDHLLPSGEHTRNHDINIAPRHCKSSIFNVLGPVWTIINTPITVTSVSHSMALSGEMVEKKQKLFNSEKFAYYFGDDPSLKLLKNTAKCLELRNGGKTYSVAMKSFTGFGSDLILNDDLISVADARQDGAVLLKARDYFKTTMPSRLNNKKTGVVVNIMQRIGRGDISDLIAEDKGLKKIYSHTEIQAISDHDETIIFPCSGKVKHIKKGDLLWEERFGDYTQLKMEVGTEDFETQYNQRPSKSRLNVIQDEFIHYIDDKEYEEFKLGIEFHYGSHDCPVKDKETSDFHGFCEGESKGNELVITDAFEKHMAYVKEREYMTNLQLVDPAIIQIVEDKANGAALNQDLAFDVPGIVPFNPGTKSKMQRLELASVYMQQGLVRFKRSDKIDELILHLKKFPLLEHDDMVDAFSQLVIYHFTQRHLGVYSGAFSYENIIDPPQRGEAERLFLTYAATMKGDSIKVVGVSQDMYKDEYIVEKEFMFSSLQSYEDFCKTLRPGDVVYDASPQNRLSTLVTGVYNNTKFIDQDRDKSINILKTGFYKKRVKVSRDCKQTINDIARMRVTEGSREKGLDQTDTLDEGMAGCLRAVITSIKGYSLVWY